ncbi:MAG TPA: hypothetical protein VNZ52_02840 [Candidatus Thermoplasmatota archaeon]|nr:hypothetical protein [Candidatus Thermoplasmatota archaeon]
MPHAPGQVRNFATNLTAISILVIGAALLAMMVFLLFQGGLGSVILALVVGIAGLAVLTGGFLFLLVPSKVDEIEDEAAAQGAPRNLEE